MFVHVVQPDETLFSISNRYGSSINQLRSVNGLEETNIVPGQALLIPLYIYTVQPNDTINDIARKAYVSLEQLKRANPSIQPNHLQVGMKIRIPDISNYIAGTLQYYA
ncbi:LysM peptidoglycan-binding domain-containing protein, partial [Sphingomonas sp. PsM26]|nr:LysM peptidoglycan-binding domain-containing protein [Sphingomonas sp. PsM26]